MYSGWFIPTNLVYVFFYPAILTSSFNFIQLGSKIRRRQIELVLPSTPDITAYWMWNTYYENEINFVPYDIQFSVNIEMAFLSGHVSVQLTIGKLPYTIDFQKMEQVSHTYGTSRRIHRNTLPSKTSLQSLLCPAHPVCKYFLECEKFLNSLNIPGS